MVKPTKRKRSRNVEKEAQEAPILRLNLKTPDSEQFKRKFVDPSEKSSIERDSSPAEDCQEVEEESQNGQDAREGVEIESEGGTNESDEGCRGDIEDDGTELCTPDGHKDEESRIDFEKDEDVSQAQQYPGLGGEEPSVCVLDKVHNEISFRWNYEYDECPVGRVELLNNLPCGSLFLKD